MFKTEQQIARSIGLSMDKWKTLSVEFERCGMPRRDDLTGMRWFPAVVEWFDRRHSLHAYSAKAPVTINLTSVESSEDLNGLVRQRGKTSRSSSRAGGISTQ